MAQRDYIRSILPKPLRYRHNYSRKKKNCLVFILIKIATIFTFVLIIFIGGLRFITKHKKEETKEPQYNKVINKILPSKPEERWRYIKELESGHPSVHTLTKSVADNYTKKSLNQLDDQHHMLVQQSMQTNEALWGEEKLTGYQHQIQAQQEQQIMHNEQLQSVQQRPNNQMQKQTARSYQGLLQVPVQKSKIQPVVPVMKEADMQKQMVKKKEAHCWVVQCGSFKDSEQAEIVLAQLAFKGFDSHITTNNGWNRVVIGPIIGKDKANATIVRLKIAGHANCIQLPSGA